MKLALFILVAGICSALTVNVPATSPTQAVLTYTAPDNAACTIEVSESNTYSPSVHDTDPILFPGSNSDARSTALTSGTARIFVVGTRHIQTASDTKNYSRALQQGTLHYYRMTCAGPVVVTGTFTTKTLPFGATYADNIPLKADGTYNWPSYSTTNRAETLIDPQTGVLLRHVSLPGDNAGDSGGDGTGGSAGGFGNFTNNVLTANGNWLVAFTDIPQGIFPNLYSINATTGAVNYLGWAGFFPASIDPNGASIHGILQGEAVSWSYTNANVAYTAYQDSANRRSLAKWTYTGNDVAQAGGTQAPNTVVDMLGSTNMVVGSDLTTLAHTFNTDLDTSQFACTFTEFQPPTYMLFTCRGGNQNSMGWLGVYNLGNELPLGSGGNGAVIAMAKMWTLPGSRWCTQHTDEYFPFAISSIAVDTAFGSGTMMGPWNSTLVGALDFTQTNVVLSSSWTFGGSPPVGWASGEPLSAFTQHYLMSYAVGDYFTIQGEVMKITTKADSAHYTVARAQGGTPADSHTDGATALATCESQGNSLTYSGGYLWWDFLASPDGTNPADYQIQFGSHPVSRGTYRVDSGWPWRAGAPTDHSTWGQAPPNNVTARPTFGGQYANCSGNACQKHPAMASGGTLSTFFDLNYWVGTSLWCVGNSSCTTNVTGSLYKYHYDTSTNFAQSPQILIARKHFPTVAKTQGRSFQDVSGPGSVVTGGSGDNYKYCVALLANECVSGSTVGDIYFNDPGLNASVGCSGGENPTIDQDICIGNWPAFGIGANQFKITNDAIGTSYRPLTKLFGAFENTATNVKLTYDGNWAMYFGPAFPGFPGGTNAVYAIKVPADPGSDGIDRTTLVPASVSVTTPSGLGITTARLRFGYLEQGPVSSYFPTSRRESGIVVSSTVTPSNPFFFASEPYSSLPCSTSCSFTIPVYPLHTAYWKVEFLTGTTVTSATTGISMENNVLSIGTLAPSNLTCNLTGTPPTTIVDVNLQTLQSLAANSCTNNLTQSGSCNVADIQRMIIAALTGPCKVGQ